MFLGAGALLAATLVLPGVNIVAAVLVGLLGALAVIGGIGGEVVWWAFLYPMANNCARTQYLYIDEMMQAGVRIFDLRINNKNWEDISAGKHEDDNKNLWLCHGESKMAGCFYGTNHDGDILRLGETLKWAKEFLKNHPTEVLMYEFDMETQDNSFYAEVVLKRLQRILKDLSYEVNPSTGKSYLYMEDGEFGKYYTYWPKLKDCRGQLLIRVAADEAFLGYNELLGGYLWPMGETTPNYTRATTGGGDTINTPEERIQNIENAVDNHPLPYVLKDALVHRNINSGSFVNTTDDPYAFTDFRLTTPPLELEEDVYYGTDEAEGILKEGGSYNQHGLFYGIFGGDGITQKEARMLWSSNFYDDLQYCTVTVKTGIDGDQQEKTYKVLKGTTITIPGSVYDNPYNGHGYFQNWKAETGDTYDWAPDYSLQDNLGFDYTRTDNQSNRDWLLAHSVLEEIDPTTQIQKNSTRIVEPGEQITIMDDTEFTAQWGPEARSAIEIEWNDCDNADGSRPKELNVSYKMRGESTVQTATVSERTDWSAAITGMLSENADDIYPVWEGVTGDDETGYACTVSQKPGKTGYTVKLSHLPSTTVDISGTISWDDNNDSNDVRPDNVTICLMLNGVEVKDQNVAVLDNMQYSFQTQPEYVKTADDTYSRNVYTVVEKPFRYYYVIQDGFDITNRFKLPENDKLSVNITWRDGANSYDQRPEYINLHLYDGSEKIASQQVAVSPTGTVTLVSFDVGEYERKHIGKQIDYRIVQEDIAGYSILEYRVDGYSIFYTNELDTRNKYFKGHSIALNGDINVNFFIDIPADKLENAKVSFRWFDKELNDISISPDNLDSTTGFYKVMCPTAVAEMTYDVTATLTLNDNVVETNHYSVYDYADVILTDLKFAKSYVDQNGWDKYEDLANLMFAMLDFGGKAQQRFDRNLELLANSGRSIMQTEVTPDMITTIPDNLNEDLEDYGLSYQYSSVVFLSGMSLRHYYEITDVEKFNAVKDTLKFVDSEKPDQEKEYAVTPVFRQKYLVYFEMKDIPAAKFDYQYRLTIGSNAYKFSVMDSIKYLMASEPDKNTMELCKTAYRYNQAANKFFGIV